MSSPVSVTDHADLWIVFADSSTAIAGSAGKAGARFIDFWQLIQKNKGFAFDGLSADRANVLANGSLVWGVWNDFPS
jgi:hypothetical protein